MSEMDLEQDLIYVQLRREYVSEAPARLVELRKDLAAARAGEPDAQASLKSRFHKLAGSGGSYGFPAITEAARTGENWLVDHVAASDDDFALLSAFVARVAAAFDDAAREVGPPGSGRRPPAFGWRAYIIGPPNDVISRIETVLRDAQYAVNTGPLGTVPTDIPASERPEVVVIVPAPEDESVAEGVAALERWLDGSIAVAFVAELSQRDLLREPFARLDLHTHPDRSESDIGRWARGVARGAGTPISAMLILPEQAERIETVAALDAAGIQVSTVMSAAEALKALRDEATDVVVVDWDLESGEGPAFVRELRRTSRFAITPILGVTNLATDNDLTEALQAGADDLLVRPLVTERLVAAVVHRARRARRLEEVVRRDSVTGFLPAAMLADEMELILAHARRGGEQLSFALLDFDHFRRINEQLGSRIGDAILTHTARVIRRRVRTSDLLIRMGGEEFGILFRSCSPSQARIITNEIRSTLLTTPPQVEGTPLPVRLSGGIAAYPDNGLGTRDIILAAERALREAKDTGRDKVLIAKS